MANYLHSNLFEAAVYKWQVPGQKRVLDATNGTSFLLNTNSFDGIRVLTASTASAYYFDNPFDHRDNSHYMTVDHSVAQLIAHMDTSPDSLLFTVGIYPDEDITATAVDHTFKVADVARVETPADSIKAAYGTYLYVRENEGFKIKKYLTEESLRGLLAIVDS